MSRTKSARSPLSKRAERTHHVIVLGYPDAQSLDISGPMDVFGTAARWLKSRQVTLNPAYSVELVGLKRGPFAASFGIRLVAERSYRDVTDADTLIIAGGIGCYGIMQDQDLLSWIRRISPKVKRLCSVCTGALILANSGLLNKKSATTHWDDVEALSRINHSIKVERDAIFVRDGKIYTSAGITAGMDMALAMVEEDWGQPTALGVAQNLVMFLKRPGGQSQFSNYLAAQFSEDDKMRELQLWILDHLEQDLSVSKLAARAAMSGRNFTRHFSQTAGLSPAQYVSRARVEAARRKLEQSSLRVSQVARRCGFGTEETMRRTFVSQLGVSPSDYRERFRTSE